MSTTLEAQWQSQAERRRRIVKLMLSVVLAGAFIAVSVCIWVAQPLLAKPSSAQARRIDPEQLRKHVVMLSQQLSARDQNNVANLDRAAVYIRDRFAASGARVTEQPFTAAGQTYRNVIASFGPEAGERIVIGAHYDASPTKCLTRR